MTEELGLDTIEQAAKITATYVSHNALSPTDLPEMVKSVHAALAGLHTKLVSEVPAEAQAPAVSIKKSITPEYLICLEDGLKFKSLKRHLMSDFGMTPEQYRAKWNLPPDYPMVAPSYSAQRSALAKSIGLGRKA